jgi:hypothetical protein
VTHSGRNKPWVAWNECRDKVERRRCRGTRKTALRINASGHCYPADAVLKKGDDDAEEPFSREVADPNRSSLLLRKVLA